MESPMCLVNNKDGSIQVVPETIQFLTGLNQPVVVVAVVGLYRTGKSYLMNKLAGKKKGFALGATVESKTKGIWMWCVPHPSKPDHTLVLLDTEGLGDVEKGDSKNDAWIFSLAILLSSTLVYNSRGTIDNQAVENLQYVSELTENIRVKSSNGTSSTEDEDGDDSQFVQFFPSFVWAVRDFTLLLHINGKDVTEDEYLEHALKLKKGRDKKTLNYNLPRECIRSYFPSRRCFVFPSPASPENMPRLESINEGDLNERFLEVTDTFCKHIFQESRVKTVKGGHRLTGRMLGHLTKTYVETIARGDVACLESAVVALAQIENQAAVEEGEKVYVEGMKQTQAGFPVDIDKLSNHHRHWDSKATEEFMKRSFKDTDGKFLSILTETLAKRYVDILTENEEASEKKCKQLLSDLSAPIAKRIQEGIYAQPGGYQLYMRDQDLIVANYRGVPEKGVRAEEVLECFLKDKSVESNSILMADKQLTEQDRRIHEATQKASMMEQLKKAESEKLQQTLQRVKDQEESHVESVRQLKAKMEQEAEEGRREMERAIQSKLLEQEKLYADNFREKQEAMREEIERLKVEMKEAKHREKEEQAMQIKALIQAVGEGISTHYNYKIAKEERKTLELQDKITARSQNSSRTPNPGGLMHSGYKGGSQAQSSPVKQPVAQNQPKAQSSPGKQPVAQNRPKAQSNPGQQPVAQNQPKAQSSPGKQPIA